MSPLPSFEIMLYKNKSRNPVLPHESPRVVTLYLPNKKSRNILQLQLFTFYLNALVTKREDTRDSDFILYFVRAGAGLNYLKPSIFLGGNGDSIP